MSAIKQTALKYAREYGWYVFRLHIGHDDKRCDGGAFNCKKVSPLDSWRNTSSNDPAVIKSWDWSKANAYGIDCGKSGIVVVDQDPGDSWHYTNTRVHGTGRGRHYIYEDLIGLGNQAGLSPWGVDIRGTGGLIVGPGSWHPHGTYEVLKDVPPGDTPVELISVAFAADESSPKMFEPLDALEALDRLNGVYRRMSETPEGQRNDMLNKLSGTAAGIWVRLAEQDRSGELSEEVIRSRLAESVTDDDDPSGSQATIESGWRYGLENPTEDATAEVINEVFDQSEVLKKIRQAAHSRILPAPGVLANCLSLVLLHTDPSVTLPPVVGARASLNLGFALVGESGASKTASAKAAREILGCAVSDEWVKPIGSGEGLIDAYYRWTAKDPEKPDGPRVLALADEWERRCLLVVDEGELLEKYAQRTGSSLSEFLRTALTGGNLGAANRKSGAAGDRSVPADSYRLVSVMNIHPRHADVLLAGESTGMPQRFLWVLAKDMTLPNSLEDVPQWPDSLDWVPPDLESGDIEYPKSIQREVMQLNLDMQHGKKTARESHATLTRLKVALALALLHSERTITRQWWELAGKLSKASLSTQDWCLAVMGEEAQKKRNQLAKASSRAEEFAGLDRVDRAVQSIVKRLMKTPGELRTWVSVRPSGPQRQGLDTEDIIERLREVAGVTVEECEQGNGQVGWKMRYDT